MTDFKNRELENKMIQALKIGTHCSEYLEIIIYEISTLKIFSRIDRGIFSQKLFYMVDDIFQGC